MVSSPSSSISLEELHLYHSIDREIFSRLLMKLSRDPAESLLIMSLWLWLEDNGYNNIIFKIITLSHHLLNALANEAVLCLASLDFNFHAASFSSLSSSSSSSSSSHANVLPVTSTTLDRENGDLSLQMFIQNRFKAIAGVKFFLNNVCARIFTDILQMVLFTGKSFNRDSEKPLVIPGFPHNLFGSVTIVPKPLDHSFPTGGLWGWQSSVDNGMSEDDRTLFLTFSRGFPVTEEEVKGLFSDGYGESCVESIEMEEVPANEQPLYAKMTMKSVGAVDVILNGKRIAKFRINGKHIWARKYERRDSI